MSEPLFRVARAVARAEHRRGGLFDREDLEQDAVVHTIEAIRDSARVEPGYVATRVRWRIRDRYKFFWRDSRDPLPDRDQADPAADTADQALTRQERLDTIRAARQLLRDAGLTVQQRRLLVLLYGHGVTEREAARVLGCSLGAVKSMRFRAHARLRKAAA